MNRIDKKFKELKKGKKKAFIAYVTAGDPNLSATKSIVLALEGAGVDIIELGIPFSDPLADGPTIQAASHRALLKGATLRKIFSLVGILRKATDIPIVFMTYYNPVLRYGIEHFVKSCKKAGVDGVIIPDLPFEEARDLTAFSKIAGIATIFLAAPTSTRARIGGIAKNSSGFVYYVSLTGVTGARSRLPAEVTSKVKLIKSVTKKPVAVGFGVSTVRQAREVSKFSDGVIVGSAIVKIIENNQKNNKALLSKVSSFAKTLAKAIHNA
ncbi:MAG: tryptophan synthase subunit alpha [Candidatus Omnitrophota bacterium]|nr:tryptophan synthase subunit alpha [Candidatus Omnitrophota bacterium]